MKKLVVLLIVLSLAATVHAGLDISFSSGNGGNWSYTAETEGIGIFSFEVASIDSLPDVDTPVTLNDSISIQSLEVRDLIAIDLRLTQDLGAVECKHVTVLHNYLAVDDDSRHVLFVGDKHKV